MGSIGNCDSREVPEKAVYKASLNNNFVTKQERARQIGVPRGQSRQICIILTGHQKNGTRKVPNLIRNFALKNWRQTNVL